MSSVTRPLEANETAALRESARRAHERMTRALERLQRKLEDSYTPGAEGEPQPLPHHPRHDND